MENHHSMKKCPAWAEIILEIFKWGLVLFLLWPMTTIQRGQFNLVRVLAGIVLFVIFAGKLLYDYIILDLKRSHDVSGKKDIFTFLGVVLGAALLVGLVLFVFALFIIMYVAEMDPRR
ncbi:hypothetical protein JW835_13080 [bacterium]|nr:hypothetical protein [bacterium]